MRCPFCGNIDTQVKDSRPAEDHVAIRRRRFCPACGGRFTTYERVQLRDLVVIKTNGKREDFDRDKLERSIRIAMQKRPIEPERIDQMISGIVRRLELPGRHRHSLEGDRRDRDGNAWPGSTPSPMCGLPAFTRTSRPPTTSTVRVRAAPTAQPRRVTPDDRRHMAHALALAARGLGRTWPNPAVGCVIVRDGRVVGRGWTQPRRPPPCRGDGAAPGGRAAQGATAYVTLEPCAHHGKTRPAPRR